MNRSIVLLATTVALAAAPACSGDDAVGESVPTLPDATAPSTTRLSPSTTDEPATTTTSTVTPPPSTTAAPPPTTTPDDVSAIAASYERAWSAFDAALSEPANAQFRAEVSRSFTDDYLIAALEVIDLYAAEGWVTRRHPEVPATFTIESVDLNGGTAELTVCDVNSDLTVIPGAGPGGDDEVVDDSVSSQRARVEMVLREGRWLPARATEIGDFPGQATCDG